jgi:uncharacterized protein (TIGR02466 family)
MEIIDLFSSFVAIDYLEIDNIVLENFCFDTFKNDPGRQISNRGGYQSNDLDLNDVRLKELIKAIENKITGVAKKIGMKPNLVHEVESMWLNVNRPNDFNVPHFHDSSFFSGVFYVTGTEGCLVLKETNGFRSNKLDNKFIQDKDSPYMVDNWNIFPEPNKLIIFPCWLLHYVFPYSGDGQRVSLAFNAKIN